MLAAATGGTSTWLTENLHGFVAAIAFYGGAFVVILSAISFGLDILKKWKDRNK